MALAHSKVTAQGQISVPAAVRNKLGIGPGAVLEWVESDGEIVLRRVGRNSSADIHRAVFGAGEMPPRPLAQMKEGIRQRVRKRYARD